VTDVSLEGSPIPGLVVLRLPVHRDSRGWFKENWQREKMVALGLPDFGPVQNNMSFNVRRGVTRGIHTEPWDKFVSVAAGRVFAAWVDMREGPSFGITFHTEIDPSVAVFVPRGVGNSYQALEDATAYTYLVNEHWRPGTPYAALDLADETAGIPWPIPLAEAEVSDKDRANPRLRDVVPMAPKKTLVLGSRGQVGRALLREFPDAVAVDRPELDITNRAAMEAWPWHEYALVLNAAAYTAVDGAETPEGRIAAWEVNARVPATLAAVAREHRLTVVHYSSDYVFDGTRDEHPEDEPFSPLGVYGQTKAAGDLAMATTPRHYLLRTSWVVGEGKNFVRTMQSLASRGACPSVVDDQVGRLTFAAELARATAHLIRTGAAFGTYNVTNGGPAMSWADLARSVFALTGRSADDVTGVSTAEYSAQKDLAPRPALSSLDLGKIRSTGFEPDDSAAALERYCADQAQRRVSDASAGRTSAR
jgi:dTDP-4-dehydrorhamnose 3,5-epimerase/reductase